MTIATAVAIDDILAHLVAIGFIVHYLGKHPIFEVEIVGVLVPRVHVRLASLFWFLVLIALALVGAICFPERTVE